jgi:hypothetical protein
MANTLVRAIEDYPGDALGELSFVKGEVFVLLAKVNPGLCDMLLALHCRCIDARTSSQCTTLPLQ